MCVICVSPKGSSQPTRDEIRAMFRHNPHGAGIMFPRKGKVHISKGYMDIEEFEELLDFYKFGVNDTVVYHFRISTQAGVCPEMTQPFPLGALEDTPEIETDARIAFCHNGIIPMTTDKRERDYSDTALFAPFLARLVHNIDDLDGYMEEIIAELIGHSKLAILDGQGRFKTVGCFTKFNGNLYSNRNHAMVGAGFRLFE